MTRTTTALVLMAAGLGVAVPASSVLAQGVRTGATHTDPRRETLTRLSQPMTIGELDNRFEDVMELIAVRTGADMDIMYLDDRNDEGFDPEWIVDMRVGETTGLELIERLITRANSDLDPISQFEWQMTEYGAIQIGPKERLNRTRQTVVYDIHDLLFEVPYFENAPEFDLSSVLQSGSGGGGGSGPFGSTNSGTDQNGDSRAERAQQLIDLLQNTVEPNEWIDLGGSSASITYIPEQLIVTAPDYVHRQISGYSYWPKRLQNARMVNGRRDMEIRPNRTQP
ncbi:MAG: hypothetical protein DHS20C14_15250 [Phycisphaeraceae bacterium]|nr:MAG: hypothetical protein DHS20C14_15250 [Phycisphaeraceae bacterium]